MVIKSETSSELPKSSVRWVSFQHGVNLAEALEPGSSKRMTRDELIALSGKLSATAVTPEQQHFVASTRVGPTLEWAVATGILEEKTDYSQAEIQKAFAALDLEHEKVVNAVTSLSTPMPMRKNYYTGTQWVSPIKGHADPDNKKYPVALYDDKKFFEDFKVDLATKKAAYGTIIERAISTLPSPDRLAIARGEVEVCAFKSPGEGGEVERTTFLIKVLHEGKTTIYQVNPELGTAVERNEFVGVFSGRSVVGKKKLADGSYAKEFTVWEKPNIQERRYQPKADQIKSGEQPDNTPFSAHLHTVEPLAKFPALTDVAAGNSNPQALFSARTKQIATTVSEKLFYMKDLDLLHLAQDDPERVTEAEKEDRENYQTFKENRDKRREFLKGFVPFWHGIEAIVAGRPIEGVAQIWIDILSTIMPVEKAVAGLVKGTFRLIKPVIPKFLKPSVNFASYTFKPGVAGVPWEGGVQGLKWTPNASNHVAKGIEQFKVSAAPLLRTQPGLKEIELAGARYFVAEKPDAGDGVHYLLRTPDPNDPSKLVSGWSVAKPDDRGVWALREALPTPTGAAKDMQAVVLDGETFYTYKKPNSMGHYELYRIDPNAPEKIISANQFATNESGQWLRVGLRGGGVSKESLASISSQLEPRLDDIAITDRPTTNSNGLVQYQHDVNHKMVMQRRDQLRKELGLDNYGAVRSEVFQGKLAQRFSSEKDVNGKLFGQCAEVAAFAAETVKKKAKDAGYRTYMVQIPSSNHTVVLLSKNIYRAGEKIDWTREFKSNSITVDLWQGVLSKDSPNVSDVLTNASKKHIYTQGKPPATIQVEMKVH